MRFEYIDTTEGLGRFRDALESAASIALDLEAAGFHRYSDRVCLAQVTLPKAGNWVLDPLAVEIAPVLRPVLEDPRVPILMHGADFDLRLLQRDLDISLRGLLDTQIVATLLGEPGIGLASLLEKYADVKLAKKYQRADWAKRPLKQEMLEYAVNDTAWLHELTRRLVVQLEQQGRGAWASEEFRLLESIEHTEDGDVDPVTRVKGARDLGPRELERLRAAWNWRDEIARRDDRAPFRVASDKVLVDVALDPPRSPNDFADRKGVNGRLARSDGGDLIAALRKADELDERELSGYPRQESSGRGRPPPEVDALAGRLKKVRNRHAESLGVDRGALLPNAVLLEIAFEKPKELADLDRIEGMKQWQIETVGEQLLTVVN
ncbi:MAG TPA: HRDC domain-containing protein [Longimicrobiales bacterium]|nr:HRDC domain-containing protein [Longimicrobiales bacterium]